MKCNIEFLSDANQKKLIHLVQSRTETFEDAIDTYKRLFINMARDMFLENSHCCCNNRKDCAYKNQCLRISECVSKILEDDKQKGSEGKIVKFFDNIKDSYIKWVNAQVSEALDEFRDVFERYNLDTSDLLMDSNELENNVYYRGRIATKDSAAFVANKMDMYHIPFTKRYLISNQRFSLGGHPLLYLANSVVGVAEELGLSIKECEEMIRVSSIEFKSTKTFRIYDLRNNIIKVMQENDNFEEYNFYNLILSALCSFHKRTERSTYSFVEEYVLPQILAQTLKMKDYTGICSFSVKQFNNVNYAQKKKPNYWSFFYENEYKINITLFPKYVNNTNSDSSYVPYDIELLKTLEISMPIHYWILQNVKLEEIANQLDSSNSFANEENLDRSKRLIQNFKEIFGLLQIEGQNYVDMFYGQTQLYFLNSIVYRLLVAEEAISHVDSSLDIKDDEPLSEKEFSYVK